MFTLGVIIGALVASIVWWIEVRGLKGTISDLKDVQADVNKIKDKVS